MNEELATRSALYAAQYAGNVEHGLYMSMIPGYWAAIIVVAMILLVGIVVLILDSMTKEEDTTWKEVNYDHRGMGEERSSDRAREERKSE